MGGGAPLCLRAREAVDHRPGGTRLRWEGVRHYACAHGRPWTIDQGVHDYDGRGCATMPARTGGRGPSTRGYTTTMGGGAPLCLRAREAVDHRPGGTPLRWEGV